MKAVKMTMKQNPETGDWLCMIPEHPSQAYYCEDKRGAKKFISEVNADLASGVLYFDGEGKLQKKGD